MKKLLFMLFAILICSSCVAKKKESNSAKIKYLKLQTETMYSYEKIGEYEGELELGKICENEVTLTYLDSKIQYIVICNKYFKDHSASAFIKDIDYIHTSWAKRDPVYAKDWFLTLPEVCRQYSFREETEFDEHFNVEMKKYYLNYSDIVAHINK